MDTVLLLVCVIILQLQDPANAHDMKDCSVSKKAEVTDPKHTQAKILSE